MRKGERQRDTGMVECVKEEGFTNQSIDRPCD